MSDLCSSDRIIALFENGARQRLARAAAFVGNRLGGGETTRARDDFERVWATIEANDQRHENAARADGRQQIGHVGRFFGVAHIGLADRKLAKVDKVEFHGIAPSEHRSRSEEHTSELQSLMRISYAVFCLKTKTQN